MCEEGNEPVEVLVKTIEKSAEKLLRIVLIEPLKLGCPLT
jgi:hypothetical protein